MSSNRNSQDVLLEYTKVLQREKADQDRERQELEGRHRAEIDALVNAHKNENDELRRNLQQSKLNAWINKQQWEDWCQEKTTELEHINGEQHALLPANVRTSAVPNTESTKSNEMSSGHGEGNDSIIPSDVSLYVEQVMAKKKNDHG